MCCFQSQYAQVGQQLLACTFLFSARLKKPPSLLPMGAARAPAGSELQSRRVQHAGPAPGAPGELCLRELPAPLGPSSPSSRSPSPYPPTLHLHSKAAILYVCPSFALLSHADLEVTLVTAFCSFTSGPPGLRHLHPLSCRVATLPFPPGLSQV